MSTQLTVFKQDLRKISGNNWRIDTMNLLYKEINLETYKINVTEIVEAHYKNGDPFESCNVL